MDAQIKVLKKVVTEQSELRQEASAEARNSVERTVAALNAYIEKLKTEYAEKDQKFSAYLTSVTPNDKDRYITARRASEAYPKFCSISLQLRRLESFGSSQR